MSTSCSPPLFICSSGQPKTQLCAFPRGASSNIMLTPRRLCMERQSSSQRSSRTSALSRGDFSPVTQDVEGFLHNIVNMGFLDRLKLAWKIIFPAPTVTENTNANIAKQRLKMILFSDRCEVSDEAKKKIVENVVAALSEFVEIESRDNVQVDISTDAGLGTVYSVTVPVRRVKPEYQESEEQYRGKIVGVDFKDTGEVSGNVDVTFDFFVPNENH
ncbi:cell division topological specificity factor homolog, chloroplastic isoform X1 [Brachypodium distachyon]|uniref:cell division topological specificity factor homolog, chloroplastic isoform X1 n=1 Tax=Brachypodium distachyon TaxID=15368 RepID=UPI00053000E3|nr:cell division topological specificity factor homolog, chloroplastic isoform X1 [Brachypodium distachyon]|eukprot:XP_010237240.1 cell division topological specificity factor homolog, chloroplastic isoform X1 [Brachypodium distachyon]